LCGGNQPHDARQCGLFAHRRDPDAQTSSSHNGPCDDGSSRSLGNTTGLPGDQES